MVINTPKLVEDLKELIEELKDFNSSGISEWNAGYDYGMNKAGEKLEKLLAEYLDN